MLKVCKFGGSSVAGAEQFRKVRDIVLSDPSRRVVVISAAGKRTSDDHKLTDLLYLCHAHLTYGVACSDILAAIRSRFVSIRDELGLSYRVEDEFDAYAATLSRDTSVDELFSRGEYFTARLMAETLGYAFVDAADCVFFGFDGQFDRARTDAAIAAAMEKNGKKYLRVVDYKSGGKTFNLSDVVSGLSTQMLIYLFAIEKNGKEKYGDIIPSGVLYMPAKAAEADLDRYASEQDITDKVLESNRMSGIIVDDIDIIKGMEHDVNGRFIPVTLTKSGAFGKRSKLIKAEDFVRLKRKIDMILKQMALNLHKGEIPVLPAKEDVCKYCDYSSVCGFEDGDSYREIAEGKDNEIIEILRNEEEENG